MNNDFAPTVGHCFKLKGEWGGVLDCEVLVVEPNRRGYPTPGTTPMRTKHTTSEVS